ncbi:alpha/beta fold hydrolase [Pedobacter arcticus]|uniref:alpha/beta fold hydrolase n=1 Tax=Pedobacter arcticus TaxID=752140 RepID=UPI0002FDA5F5|nr:alpha/beta fold hydrolase [Pedobacter arcticus]
MKKNIIAIFLLLLTSVVGKRLYGQDDLQIRQQYLTDLKKIIIDQRIQKNTRRVSVQDSTWVDWLKRSGELPPNFAKMKSTPFLPDPLVFEENGKELPIKTKEQWQKKREWIKEEYKHWISGTFPDPPKNLKSEILLDSVSNNVRIVKVKLSFGPSHAAVLHLELWLPEGKKNLPVFMTQFTHKDWGRLALRRGYAVCTYAASDGADDTEAYQKIYPNYDFSTLMRRAWGASRAIDYLYTRPEINKNQIAITGHSRNGKQSLWAAAFDERITAVVSSSSGTGGDAPWRFGDPQYASETLDLVTAANAHWFHPRLRFFFGNEDRLSVDQNSLASLIAPRALLFHYSVTEAGLNAWANEQNYYATKKVYEFLGEGDRIGVHTRRGEHAVASRDVEFTLDFLDKQFNRNNITWHNNLFYTYDYNDWLKNHSDLAIVARNQKAIHLKANYKSIADFEKEKSKVLTNVSWLLGEKPGSVKPDFIDIALKSRYDWIESIIGTAEPKNGIAHYYGPYAAMGDHIPVRVYYPKNSKGKIEDKKYPTVIYLHQYAHSTGYAKGYNKLTAGQSNDVLFSQFLAQGYAVVAFDLFGFGSRMEEAVNFYQRNPSWSKMGKMVTDVSGVLDGLYKINNIDQNKIFVLGNTLGGTVGIYAAALDNRVKALVSVSGFSPYRSSNLQYESIRTMSHLHGLIPRLGFFADTPKDAPVDLEEMLACIAPRPMMVVAPTLDRYGDRKQIENAVAASKVAYGLYGKSNNLQLYQPEDINRLSPESVTEIIKFFNQVNQGR